MKSLLRKFLLITCYASQVLAGSIAVINSTSGQVSITLQTTTSSTTQSVLPNENQFLNDINNPSPQPTMISYDGSPITKIVITRLSTNMPQVIYCDNESTNQNSNGIIAINRTKQGNMRIYSDYVDINNLSYSLNDLSSYIVRSNQLRNNVSSTNLDDTQKNIDDLTTTIKIVEESDKASQLESQIAIIQSSISSITNGIQIMKTFNQNLNSIQDLQNNLSDDTLDKAQKTLQDLQDGLQTMTQSGLNGALYDQAQALQNALNKLQAAIEQIKSYQQNIGISGSVVVL